MVEALMMQRPWRIPLVSCFPRWRPSSGPSSTPAMWRARKWRCGTWGTLWKPGKMGWFGGGQDRQRNSTYMFCLSSTICNRTLCFFCKLPQVMIRHLLNAWHLCGNPFIHKMILCYICLSRYKYSEVDFQAKDVIIQYLSRAEKSCDQPLILSALKCVSSLNSLSSWWYQSL